MRENDITDRENVEWSNYWWSDACMKSPEKKRYLVIGDSTSRGYRSALELKLGGIVDFFGSSARITDVLFWKQIECFLSFSEYKYDGIQIQLGYHGIDLDKDSADIEVDKWAEAYNELVKKLLKYSSHIVLASATHTVIIPNRCEIGFVKYVIYKIKFAIQGSKCEIKDVERNRIIQLRNSRVQKIAEDYHLEFLDLYKIMMHSKFRHIDIVHFEESHKPFISAMVAEKLGCKQG